MCGRMQRRTTQRAATRTLAAAHTAIIGIKNAVRAGITHERTRPRESARSRGGVVHSGIARGEDAFTQANTRPGASFIFRRDGAHALRIEPPRGLAQQLELILKLPTIKVGRIIGERKSEVRATNSIQDISQQLIPFDHGTVGAAAGTAPVGRQVGKGTPASRAPTGSTPRQRGRLRRAPQQRVDAARCALWDASGRRPLGRRCDNSPPAGALVCIPLARGDGRERHTYPCPSHGMARRRSRINRHGSSHKTAQGGRARRRRCARREGRRKTRPGLRARRRCQPGGQPMKPDQRGRLRCGAGNTRAGR